MSKKGFCLLLSNEVDEREGITLIANILQLSAGILLGISSFIDGGKFQVPVIGEKLPGSLEKFKQTWMIRIGLALLILGYALPIMEWNPQIIENHSKNIRIIFAFVLTGAIVIVGYTISNLLAKRDFKNAPLVGDKNDGMPDGGFAYHFLDESDSEK